MRDAMGGVTTLIIIVVFIVIALGYMSFNVNYTKAFRMKDKIVALYDDYNGECESNCQSKIVDYAHKIGYSTGGSLSNCSGAGAGFQTNSYGGKYIYCYQKVETTNRDTEAVDEQSNGYYYRIVTKINLEIPIISRVLDLRFFYIYGDTKTYKKR